MGTKSKDVESKKGKKGKDKGEEWVIEREEKGKVGCTKEVKVNSKVKI